MGVRSRLFDDSSKVCRPPGCGECLAKPTATSLMWMQRSVMCAERAAGADLSDRIYVRREKERDVAAVFLVDVSGSTSRQLESAAA